jgi:hypothetical protein
MLREIQATIIAYYRLNIYGDDREIAGSRSLRQGIGKSRGPCSPAGQASSDTNIAFFERRQCPLKGLRNPLSPGLASGIAA